MKLSAIHATSLVSPVEDMISMVGTVVAMVNATTITMTPNYLMDYAIAHMRLLRTTEA